MNLATDSEGTVYSGAPVRNLRRRHARLRAKLQAKGTRGAKRLLRKRRRKEQRFAGIWARITVKKAQRRDQHSWAFYQMRQFITYKAVMAGVPVILVDPRNTSRTCPACGHCAKGNRVSQRKFLCEQCGFAGLADHIAAENIRRAAVNQPHSTVEVPTSAS